jgi:hypothetical protein
MGNGKSSRCVLCEGVNINFPQFPQYNIYILKIDNKNKCFLNIHPRGSGEIGESREKRFLRKVLENYLQTTQFVI